MPKKEQEGKQEGKQQTGKQVVRQMVDKLPRATRMDLEKAGYSDDEINSFSSDEAIDKWLECLEWPEWLGIIGYSNRIISTVKGAYDCKDDCKDGCQENQPINDPGPLILNNNQRSFMANQLDETTLAKIRNAMVEVTAPAKVEIEIKRRGKEAGGNVIYLHVNGITLVRMCRVKDEDITLAGLFIGLNVR